MKNVPKILAATLFTALLFLPGGCKSSYVLTDAIKGKAQDLTPEAAADRLNSLVEKDKTIASTGFDDVIFGGETTITKDSISFRKTIGPQADKTASGFAGGYGTTSYSDRVDVIITVEFKRVKSYKIHELKNGDITINLKDGHKSFLTRTMCQVYVKANDKDQAIALFSRLIPDAEIES